MMEERERIPNILNASSIIKYFCFLVLHAAFLRSVPCCYVDMESMYPTVSWATSPTFTSPLCH